MGDVRPGAAASVKCDANLPGELAVVTRTRSRQLSGPESTQALHFHEQPLRVYYVVPIQAPPAFASMFGKLLAHVCLR